MNNQSKFFEVPATYRISRTEFQRAFEDALKMMIADVKEHREEFSPSLFDDAKVFGRRL